MRWRAIIKMADLQIDLWTFQLKVQSRAISQFIVDKAGSEAGAKFRSGGSNVFHGAIDKSQNSFHPIGWSATPTALTLLIFLLPFHK